jgi:hypothetical protein
VLWTKESYIKEFLKQTSDTLADGSYDVSKIEAVLDVLIAECTAIAVDQWDPVDVELRARLARARIARLTRGGR